LAGRAYHGLDTYIVANIIRVAVIDNGAHASVDDRLEVCACRSRPVTGRGELVVYVQVGFNPCTLRANLGHQCCAVKVWFKCGRIRVRIRRGHVIFIPVVCKRHEDARVAEGLGGRADRIASPIITCDDLSPLYA
jgi:hypothetical protein